MTQPPDPQPPGPQQQAPPYPEPSHLHGPAEPPAHAEPLVDPGHPEFTVPEYPTDGPLPHPEPSYPEPPPHPEPSYPEPPPHQQAATTASAESAGHTPHAPPPYPGALPPSQTVAPPPIPPQPTAAPQGTDQAWPFQDPARPHSHPAPPHPHDLDFAQRRVHLAERQRGADATALGGLLLYIPNFLCSLLIVVMVSAFFGGIGLLLVLLWLASGLLVFHRPTEGVIARHLLRLRYPTIEERAGLEPVWREVTARAGVDGRAYELWIEESDQLNAVAAAGHIVGVTRFAVHQLPSGQLGAVLAHELGHHIGGHSWSSLLGYWYALPGRVVWRLIRMGAARVRNVSGPLSCFGVGLVLMVFGGVIAGTLQTLYGLPLLLLAMPYALAAVGRRSELRADQQAAALGFAPMLVEVLNRMEHQAQQAAWAALPGGAVPPPRQEGLAKLLASHPDFHTRMHHLQPYLQPRA